MPTDLTTVRDHPANLLDGMRDVLVGVLPSAAGSRLAIEMMGTAGSYLRDYEKEKGVTFTALDNDGLDRVREAWDGLYSNYEDGQVSTSEFVSAVGDLLGLED